MENNVKKQDNQNEIGNQNEENVLDVTGEKTVIEQIVEEAYDPDEKILKEMYDSGKREIFTNDLLTAGFDSSRMSSYTFSVGKYKLSRLLLIAPYIIEKTN